MPERPFGNGPPHGFLRAFLRAPICLYRLRLGWLLGSRFLLLTHVGRKSGQARQTVLEVVRHDEKNGAYVVASGWGEKSNWLLNIRQTPQVKITIGLHRFDAMAIRLSPEEAEQELLDYTRRFPRASQMLSKRMIQQPPQDAREACRLLAQSLPLVVFRSISQV